MLKLLFIAWLIATIVFALLFPYIMMTLYWYYALDKEKREELEKNDYKVLI